MTTAADHLISVRLTKAAELTGVSARTIDRACKASEAEKLGVPLLPSKLIGGSRVVLIKDLTHWAQNLPDA